MRGHVGEDSNGSQEQREDMEEQNELKEHAQKHSIQARVQK